MNAWWVGTVSTVIGAVTGALLQAWRERALHKRQLATRWDQALLAGLTDYLATADRTVRALLRWRNARFGAEPDVDAIATAATEAFESLHEKSQVISLLTGDRGHPVREASRRMRETLLPLCEEVRGRELDTGRFRELVTAHRDARNALIRAAQVELSLDTRRA